MKIHPQSYRVAEGSKVTLHKWATAAPHYYKSKRDHQKLLAKHIEELDALHQLHYAANEHALLVILQAMDAAGKDGVIRHVMSGVNPQGCQVHSFKAPTLTELEHDFLWRTTCVLPERGNIGIFNRSYYEEVLIARVHPALLHKEGILELGSNIWSERYRSIVDFERHLHRNGTRIVKFFLHISKWEQRKRFLARIEEPQKNWKFSLDDIRERGYWKQYMRAYGECLSATSTEFAPWFVVPGDDKPSARLIVSQVLLETLRALKSTYPVMSAKRRRELGTARKALQKDR
jgi:PPK2 family polyphosphate:nucleotide phosphotransferase